MKNGLPSKVILGIGFDVSIDFTEKGFFGLECCLNKLKEK